LRPIGTDAKVVVDLGFVGSVAPVRLFIHIVGGSPFELTLVEVNAIAPLPVSYFRTDQSSGWYWFPIPRKPPKDMIA
jgi:hypothetical protein